VRHASYALTMALDPRTRQSNGSTIEHGRPTTKTPTKRSSYNQGKATSTVVNDALCEECDRQLQISKCQDCEILFCDTCRSSAEIRRVEGLQRHRTRTALCRKCPQNLATLACTDCHVFYCKNCSVGMHAKGKLKVLNFAELSTWKCK
jgi:hypothetical protein